MNHAEQKVDLIDEKGGVVGVKKRQEINKQTDLYHTVFIILCTPDKKLVLSKIPHREDLPNLYAGQLGPTVSTIRRHEESSDDASIRAIKNELFLEGVQLAKIGESYLVLPDNHRKYMSVYLGTNPVPDDFSHTDIESLHTFARSELEEELKTNQAKFAPTFLAIWQLYSKNLLPV